MTQSKSVVKRDGSIVPLDIAKIKKCIAWAAEGLDVNELALESKFNEYLVPEMSTRSIQNSLITAARSLASRAEPDWTTVEGRLLTMNLWKERKTYEKTEDCFYDWMQEQVQKGEYKGPLVLDLFTKYTPENFRYLSTLIDQKADLNQSYGSVFTGSQKYLTPSECTQQMFLVNAMIIASIEEADNRARFAAELYINMKDRKLSFASPWLSNLRVGGSIDSCFIIEPTDNIDSIFRNVSNAAKISKAGGGLGISLSRIRAKGSDVNGRKNASKGVFGWARIFNDVALFVDQGGRRAGAFTVQLPVWHRDIEDFLEIQSETGDFRAKAYDIFPQVTVPDYFMELDKKDGKNIDWYTFCPHEVKTVLGIELYSVFGDDFVVAYHSCVEAYKEGKLTVVGVHKVRDLFKHMMRTHFDSGLPYIAFIDEINRENPNNHIGDIPCVNLCVAPETLILTDKGHIPIEDVAGEKVNVWNGEEWSEVDVVKTGENQKLLKVTTNFGQELECTEYHKFYVMQGYRQIVEKRAYQLENGDKLIKMELPVIQGERNWDHAYVNGFLTGDGTFDKARNYNRIYLYHEKRKLRKHMETCGLTSWHVDENNNRECTNTSYENIFKPKFFVPDTTYTVESRLEWLAGYLDADGTIARNGDNESLQAASTDLMFLKNVQNMLQTLGVQSKVSATREQGSYDLPANDGTDALKPFNCSKTWRLLISSNGLYNLSRLGFKTRRLEWAQRKPQRNCERFVTITNVEDTGRIDDTYCFTEPKRHMGIFNGILTGQCTESFSTVVPDKYAHSCNLASIVVGRCKDLEEVKYLSGLLTRALDNGIELSRSPVKEAHDHSQDFRTIGIGIQGLHDWLAKEHLSYKDHVPLSHLAEAIQYGAVKESIKLAEERGAYTYFQGSKWANGKMFKKFKSNPNAQQDWDSLEDDLSRYGIRNSQLTSPAPNTTTSIFMDAGAGVMPVYMDFYQKDNGNGTFPFASMFLKENPLSYAKNASKWEHIHLVKSVSAVQQWTCAGVSAEFFLDHNKPDFNAKELYDLIHNAWEHKMKAIYYIRHIKKGKQYHDAIGVLAEAKCDGCTG